MATLKVFVYQLLIHNTHNTVTFEIAFQVLVNTVIIFLPCNNKKPVICFNKQIFFL